MMDEDEEHVGASMVSEFKYNGSKGQFGGKRSVSPEFGKHPAD